MFKKRQKIVEKQYGTGWIDLINIAESLIDKFKNEKSSIDYQQLQLIAEYLIAEREFDEVYIEELERNLDMKLD